MSFIIKAENVSKAYRLGLIGSGTLSADAQRWYSRIRGKEDPFSKVCETNDRSVKGKSNQVWSLKDVNFEVEEGEAIGVIGSNGAGKSTLLKILTRVTSPTTGKIIGRGRIASLLEVGTGFHFELTGRENIYLNGAILGMRKKEISRKFDEIVDFSGVERYIDTPVKRYSSGMYVRLAFAVAAHLESEILVLDEVLAVGDAEFQKKCLGKMNEVSSKQGRTVIFVSHNMTAIFNLCFKAIWLDKGSIVAHGPATTVVNQYLGGVQRKTWKQEFKTMEEAPGNEFIKIRSVELIPDLTGPLTPIDIRTSITINFSFYNLRENMDLVSNILLFTLGGDCIFNVASKPDIFKKGVIDGTCTIPGNFLNNGSYFLSLYFSKDTSNLLFPFDECLFFDVADFRENVNRFEKWKGHVRPNFPVLMQSVDVEDVKIKNREPTFHP